jgi:protein involved in ribonucleotide reduction
VIAAGNTNFGESYCFAGNIISQKCHVPYLYRFELMGTAEDVERVKVGLGEFWEHLDDKEQELWRRPSQTPSMRGA